MGVELGTAVLIGSLLSTAATGASMLMTPTSSSMDTTNYDLLRQTQAEADAESEAAKARTEEARKREELRQQQMAGQDIMTTDTGVDSLSVRNQVLGSNEEDEV